MNVMFPISQPIVQINYFRKLEGLLQTTINLQIQ